MVVTLRLTPSFLRHEAEIGFGVGAAVAGGAAVPIQSLSIVALDPPPASVKIADFILGVREILVRRLAVPLEGLLIITPDLEPTLVHGPQIVLRARIALVRGQTVVIQGPLVISMTGRFRILGRLQGKRSVTGLYVAGLCLSPDPRRNGMAEVKPTSSGYADVNGIRLCHGGIRPSPREEPGIPMNGLWRSCLDHLKVWVLGV